MSEQLVLDHLPLVDALARRAAQRLPRWLELDDLIQTGRIALIESAARFDAGRGSAFPAFASKRILGAIYDANRRKNYRWELHAELDAEAHDVAVPNAIEIEAERKRMAKHLCHAMRDLTPDEGFAVVHHAVLDCPYSSIGMARKRSTSWAFYQARSGREKLRRSLGRVGVRNGSL